MDEQQRQDQREYALALMRGEFADRYKDKPLLHDCESEDFEPTTKFRSEHKRRGEPLCQFAVECARWHSRQRNQDRQQEEREEASEDGPTEPGTWVIYRLRFCGRPEWYIGLTDNLERRFNQHVRKSSNRTIRRLVEEGHHLLYPEILVDGLKSLAHAEGAELALLATASRPEDCINDQHNPNGKTRTPPV